MTAQQIMALLEAAAAARQCAHAPYSGFSVGAAVLTDDGRVFSGCNVENASYGLTMCAERVAVGRAVTEGARAMDGVAIVTGGKVPAAPCGACRQVLAEFCQDDCVILIASVDKVSEYETLLLGQLLPRAFRCEDMDAGRNEEGL